VIAGQVEVLTRICPRFRAHLSTRPSGTTGSPAVAPACGRPRVEAGHGFQAVEGEKRENASRGLVLDPVVIGPAALLAILGVSFLLRS
jgi:hypothetical protein